MARRKGRLCYGEPLPRLLTPGEIVRFLAKVRVSAEPPPEGFQTPCWLWTGHTCPKGYAQVFLMGQARWAHRVSVEVFRGQLKRGKDSDHKCRVRNCVNPEHVHCETMKYNRGWRGRSPEQYGARRESSNGQPK